MPSGGHLRQRRAVPCWTIKRACQVSYKSALFLMNGIRFAVVLIPSSQNFRVLLSVMKPMWEANFVAGMLNCTVAGVIPARRQVERGGGISEHWMIERDRLLR
jgi:hypothetical protein